MAENPDKFWEKIPHEIQSYKSDELDVPMVHNEEASDKEGQPAPKLED